MDLTFGEQVKIILSRKGMTIKELAEIIEERTGKKMSRQNLTQRLGRDNFQEQDMRMIAGILGCPFYLSILGEDIPAEAEAGQREGQMYMEDNPEQEQGEDDYGYSVPEDKPVFEREITVGEVVDIQRELVDTGLAGNTSMEEILKEVDALERENKKKQQKKEHRAVFGDAEKKLYGWKAYLQRKLKNAEGFVKEAASHAAGAGKENVPAVKQEEPATEALSPAPKEKKDPYEDEAMAIMREAARQAEEEPEDIAVGDVNPYTGHEYLSNTVRMHPERIGYVQVYDRGEHKWTDMTQWAFLGYQDRKKALLGKDYEPPIYLD